MLNSNKFTFVNVCFQYERNDDSGLYGQTLIKSLRLLEKRKLIEVFIRGIIYIGRKTCRFYAFFYHR